MAERALITGVGGKEPKVDQEAFTAPTSVVIGDVTLAAGASVWYHAVLRADAAPIGVARDSNIQDNCTVHVDPGFPVTVGERVSVGHNAVVHGCDRRGRRPGRHGRDGAERRGDRGRAR